MMPIKRVHEVSNCLRGDGEEGILRRSEDNLSLTQNAQE